MIRIRKASIIICLISLLGCNSYSQNGEKNNFDSKAIEIKMVDTKYPWNSEITKLAIEAINKSIQNLQLPKNDRPRNFPNSPGPYNVPFNQNEIVEFTIIGYSFSQENPNVYEMDFRPKDELGSGNRITVKVNIKSKEVLMVFMQADA